MNDPRELPVGAVFAGNFTILRRVGEGSMGIVYAVYQQSTSKERALKLFWPGLVEVDHQREFEKELGAIARISSPHFTELLGAGIDPDTGVSWVAMELLRGEPIGDLVARFGGLPRVEAMVILRELCHVIGAAHALRLAHGALTSKNLFFADGLRADGRRTVKVLGFEKSILAMRSQANVGASKWELRWMAPEMAKHGRRREPASDVWAIGLIAFFLFTGREYWRASMNAEASVLELLSEVLIHPLPAASARARELKRAVPAGFDTWFAQAIDREPSQRFENAQVAYERLAALVKST